MPRFLAIALRLVVVFTLAVNGIGVAAYAMHAQDAATMAAATAVSDDERPCHGMDEGGTAMPDTPADDGFDTAHDCCGKTCSCDFVAAAALAPVPWPVVAPPPSNVLAGLDTGRLVAARASLPLRPPIA